MDVDAQVRYSRPILTKRTGICEDSIVKFHNVIFHENSFTIRQLVYAGRHGGRDGRIFRKFLVSNEPNQSRLGRICRNPGEIVNILNETLRSATQ
jgi:hypothetical protein